MGTWKRYPSIAGLGVVTDSIVHSEEGGTRVQIAFVALDMFSPPAPAGGIEGALKSLWGSPAPPDESVGILLPPHHCLTTIGDIVNDRLPIVVTP
jgi:hypothetical protein